MIYFAKWKVILILGICAVGLAFSAPNFFNTTSDDPSPDAEMRASISRNTPSARVGTTNWCWKSPTKNSRSCKRA